ncbi:hypothetical protein JXQ70_16910 [bacterium]|nr:hypothetical protein [bacterium]
MPGQVERMNAAEILDEFSVKIYEPPLALIREDDRITDLSNPVVVLMLVIDFETELSMNGINDFIGNSTGRYGALTVDALNILGCKEAAETLTTILKAANSAGMTHEAIQLERQGLEPYTITTFLQLHGAKWEQVSTEISELAHQIDFQIVFEAAEEFIDHNRADFLAALNQI